MVRYCGGSGVLLRQHWCVTEVRENVLLKWQLCVTEGEVMCYCGDNFVLLRHHCCIIEVALILDTLRCPTSVKITNTPQTALPYSSS